ncbi:unnamed protein product [Anisakis simplex]|uniref:HL07962p (inferred by orthology to a D. melanogaster protein) n=1 Tax=Anisakis simplex TaxID=6269 RepID=A0A0M3JVA7_ANISI|nr:unnamed protein product [Anisakis simplex]
MDCFADDREALNDFAKYFNNAHLSDVTLLVGDEILCIKQVAYLKLSIAYVPEDPFQISYANERSRFFRYSAHRIILTKSSEVFDRMLSQKWNGEKKELELVEEPQCQRVFAAFLRFLYCNHILLHPDNALPILVLADKYNVHSLRKVCIEYAINNILPELSLRELFHVWYSYATKAFHQVIEDSLIYLYYFDIVLDDSKTSTRIRHIVGEYRLWEAVQKWLMAPSHPERRGNTASPLLVSILPLIRFPFMTADELTLVERSPFVETHPKLFHPQILLAYKFQALPLASRLNCKEFTGTQFILRNYTDVRWDRRIVVRGEDLRIEDAYNRTFDQAFGIQTRSSTFPLQSWNWKLQLSTQLVPNSHEELRMYLVSEDIDQPRSIEYLVSIVDEKKVLKSLAGRKNFTKTRYCADLEIEKKVDLNELYVENSPLLVNGDLHLQITFRPID